MAAGPVVEKVEIVTNAEKPELSDLRANCVPALLFVLSSQAPRRNHFDWCSPLPRVNYGDPRCLKMTQIPRHNCHSMNERSRCDESIPIRARIWHMKRGTPLSNNGINGQDATGEGRQDVTVDPGSKDRALFPVALFDQKGSYLEFQY